MKLTVLYAAMPGYDFGLDKVTKIVTNTLRELGEEIETYNLAYMQIPYYDGISSSTIEPILKSIRSSSGVIFASVTLMYSPCAVLKTFIEHLESEKNKNILENKNCMIITTSKSGGERTTIEFLSNVIGQLGGYDAIRLGLGVEFSFGIADGNATNEWIEKQTENYYRVLRQNQKFIVPKYESLPVAVAKPVKQKTKAKHDVLPEPVKENSMPAKTEEVRVVENDSQLSFDLFNETKKDVSSIKNNESSDNAYVNQHTNDTISEEKSISEETLVKEPLSEESLSEENLSDDEYFALFGKKKKKPEKVSGKVAELYKKHENLELSEDHENDINEITQLFAKKYVTTDKGLSPVNVEKINSDFNSSKPGTKTCKQLTMNLEHYFNPQLAGDLNTIIQISVTGAETFDCYIEIVGSSCVVSEGKNPAAEIVVMSSDNSWTDVLKGKYTAQKAFMVGQLKVRGNFLLLSRFDQLFNKQ